MRLVGVAILASLGTMMIVFSGCTVLSGADRLTARCDGVDCEVETTRDNITPSPAGTNGGGNGSTTTPSSSATPNPSTTPTTDAGNAMPDSTASKRSIECDNVRCSGFTPFCCQFPNGPARCTATIAECTNAPFGVALACGNSKDCSTGEVCCADASVHVAQCAIRSACAGASKRVLCDDDDECTASEVCFKTSPMFDRDYCEPF